MRYTSQDVLCTHINNAGTLVRCLRCCDRLRITPSALGEAICLIIVLSHDLLQEDAWVFTVVSLLQLYGAANAAVLLNSYNLQFACSGLACINAA